MSAGGGAAGAAAGLFALGVCVGMLSGRVPFDLGFAVGLASVLTTMRGQLLAGLALAVLTSACSPVAGAFLALAGIAYAAGCWGGRVPGARARLANGSRRTPWRLARWAEAPRPGLALAAAALMPVLVLTFAYPEGGYEPFAPSAFWPALAGVLAIALLLPRGPLGARAHRALRAGALLYALALIASFALHTPMGGNAARLGALLAAPLVTGALWERHRLALVCVAPALLWWQLATPIRDLASIANDPSVHPSYYAPLLAELRRLDSGGGNRPAAREQSGGPSKAMGRAGVRHGAPADTTIVEVPLTKAHWEAAYLAGAPLAAGTRIALARGWERQLDTRYAQLFYRPILTSTAYRDWLATNRVAYVALPDAPLDRAGRAEGVLIAHGLPFLREVWRANHWRLFRFMGYAST